MFMRESLRLFGGIGQDPLALVRERQVRPRSKPSLGSSWCPSICFRIDSTDAWLRKKRFVSALSSRKRPSSKCSVSM